MPIRGSFGPVAALSLPDPVGDVWVITTNYGEWHVDHIRPCMSFDLSEIAQQETCCNWRNLQPLWAADNLSKNDKWTPAMEAEWVQNMIALGWEGDLFLTFDTAVAA